MNVLGKVKYEVLDSLFQAGYFPCPEEIENVLEIFRQKEVLEDYNRRLLEYTKRNKLLQKFSEKPEIYDSERQLLNTNLGVYLKHHSKEKNLHTYYFKAQDIKTVLETLCVAKNSQSSFVLADSSKLRTLQRVVDNSEEYINLLKSLESKIRYIENNMQKEGLWNSK